MDRTPTAQQQLLAAALETARALGLTAEVMQTEPALGRGRADALISIGRGDGEKALYAAEVRRGVRPATLGATLVQLERLGQQALLVTDYVTPPMAEELKARRIAFLDAAGNAYLEQASLLVWVKGHKPAAPAVAPEVGRAFQPTGLQVLFALLCNPAVINRPYRELAAMAGVAHGTVGWVIPDLQREGYVADLKGKRGTRRLFQLDRLLGQWVDAYARQLRPRTLIGRYYVPKIEGWRDWPLAQHAALWGGEPAGALLTDYLRPGELTIYARKLPALLAARQKFLKEPAPGNTAIVEVRRRFWDFPVDREHPGIVPPVLVYADLLATGDARCIETAKMVYKRMSLDFSNRFELNALAHIVRAVQAAAEPAGIEFCLTGAAARDLMTRHAHGIEPSRLTEDIDFAVMVRDWNAYERLRERLIASGEFSPRPGPATHRLRHASGLPLDIVPFGGIEGRDRKFAWPPDRSTVFDCFGMNEAFEASVTVELPGAVRLLVPPIPALTMLKIAAWEDRKHTHPGRDAPDLLLYLAHYMDCGNLERAAEEHGDLFESEQFDHVEAGVRLLARDMTLLLDRQGVERLLQILVPETDEAGSLLLAHQAGHGLDTSRRLLEVLCDELAEGIGSMKP